MEAHRSRPDSGIQKYSTSANERDGHLVATLKPHKDGNGLEGEHRITIDNSTRIWRGKELLGVDDLIEEGFGRKIKRIP